jgi:hypothetical protein
VFHELSSGGFLVTETSKIFETPRLGDAVVGKSMADIYNMIQPKDKVVKVPDALVAADARLAALKAALKAKPGAAPLGPPPTPLPGGGRGPKPFNAGEQAWFKQTFCHDIYGHPEAGLSLVDCYQGFSYVTGDWSLGPHFTWESLAGSEGVTATLTVFQWMGHDPEVISYQIQVPPGHYSWGYYDTPSPIWLHACLSGAGDNTQVSQDEKNCGNGGQWACAACDGTISCNVQGVPPATGCSVGGTHYCTFR